jgi:hypothetical protein
VSCVRERAATLMSRPDRKPMGGMGGMRLPAVGGREEDWGRDGTEQPALRRGHAGVSTRRRARWVWEASVRARWPTDEFDHTAVSRWLAVLDRLAAVRDRNPARGLTSWQPFIVPAEDGRRQRPGYGAADAYS